MDFQSFNNPNDQPQIEDNNVTMFLNSLLNPLWKKNIQMSINSHNSTSSSNINTFNTEFQIEGKISLKLMEYFPIKWVNDINSTIKALRYKRFGIKSDKDIIYLYLGFIELYLNFRGLALLDSTLIDIKLFFKLDIRENSVKNWKMKLIRLVPGLREKWFEFKSNQFQSAIFSNIIFILNKSLTECTQEELFHTKQKALSIARDLCNSTSSLYTRDPETLANEICFQAMNN
jgi:hypothetical protein